MSGKAFFCIYKKQYGRSKATTLSFFLLYDSLLYEDLLQDLNTTLNMLLGMCRHKRETHERVLRRACWRHHGVDEHTLVESQLGHEERLGIVTHVKRNDRTLCLTNLKALLTETIQGIVGDIPQVLAALWLILNDMECLQRASRSGWRVAR